MDIKGKVKRIGSTMTIGNKGFRKRELVVDVTRDPKYPEYVPIEFVQDSVDKLGGLREGQDVTVNVSVGGREWVSPQGETKYFASVKGWKVEVEGGQATVGQGRFADVEMSF